MGHTTLCAKPPALCRWGKVDGMLERNTHHQTVCLCLSVLCINPVKNNYAQSAY